MRPKRIKSSSEEVELARRSVLGIEHEEGLLGVGEYIHRYGNDSSYRARIRRRGSGCLVTKGGKLEGSAHGSHKTMC